MRMAIILSLISVITMFTVIEYVVNHERIPLASDQITEITSKPIDFEKHEQVDTHIQTAQLVKKVEFLKGKVD